MRHSRIAFFNHFLRTFGEYLTTVNSRVEQIAWKDIKIAQKKAGKSKTAVVDARIQVTATWGETPEFQVDTIYLDKDGEEVSRGRKKKADSVESALEAADKLT